MNETISHDQKKKNTAFVWFVQANWSSDSFDVDLSVHIVRVS